MRSYARTRIPAIATTSTSLKSKRLSSEKVVVRFLMDSTFNQVDVRRLEADSALRNGRGNGAPPVVVRAVQAGAPWKPLRRNCPDFGRLRWSILGEELLQAKAVWGPKYH